ncbi:hypothetical protein LGL08_20495 [Clostridium estertheticum]|uniref:phBC6A51 family helix-turn-helix protein n=1 Tax=Clostridium estertheticum TaxID=238834 RepID=UPI001CF5B36F|nr:phBC6A51 family helix-turn-helix protein [Clostridium estertheticum]MCB2308837.1 hypothetical protein [Clostridium estertheticum]MCB2347325.1 hypothetical protein [Clostridium estertheticum]MCB2351909.1 hypothetical protein [Clostridium estertheticum]WAG48523.1 hypothetical protein LL127_23305 [Clostridium estertheticum]
MIWDEKKKRALDLMVENDMKDADIAKEIGCVRQTIWEWRKLDEFTTELTRRKRDKKKRIVEFGEVILYEGYELALNKIKYDIENGSPRNSLMAAMWWAEKIGGKPTTKVDISNVTDNKDVVDPDTMAKEIEEFNTED